MVAVLKVRAANPSWQIACAAKWETPCFVKHKAMWGATSGQWVRVPGLPAGATRPVYAHCAP